MVEATGFELPGPLSALCDSQAQLVILRWSCALRSDDTDAIAGAASGPLSVGWIVLQAATPCSLLNCCHPRLVNAHRLSRPAESREDSGYGCPEEPRIRAWIVATDWHAGHWMVTRPPSSGSQAWISAPQAGHGARAGLGGP